MEILGGLSPQTIKYGIMFIVACGWFITLLFSFIPVSDKYTGYAISGESMPAYWTGFGFVLGPVLLNILR